MGFAFNKTIAKDKLTGPSKVLNDHVLKGVIYGDSLGYSSHWIDEISTWLYLCSKVSCKSKMKPSLYKQTLFSWFGETKEDCESNLYDFMFKYVDRSKKYPSFEIDKPLIEHLYKVYTELANKTISMYTDKYIHTKQDYKKMVEDILQ